ncbi:MAG: DegT/DnrJ/EryC1/StrS family aminotransferase [Gammaproteobacteria bacterium]
MPPTAGLPLGWRDLSAGRTADFAERVAAFLEVAEVQIECSGTACLIVALSALRDSSTRRTVIIPAYTCPLVPLAIANCGLKVKICDLAREHFDMDPRRLAALCDSDTLAVMPTHLAGRIADLEAASMCAQRVGARVIEDAAQAFAQGKRNLCASPAADVTFFSLAVGKGLTLYEGGVLYAPDTELRSAMAAASARIIGRHRFLECRRVVQLLGYAALYRPLALSFAYGAPLRRAIDRGDLAGAVGDRLPRRLALHRVGSWRRRVGTRALARLPEFQQAAIARANTRVSRLQRVPSLKVFADPPGVQGSWPCLLVLMPTQTARDSALVWLWRAGLGVTRLFVHALEDYPDLHSIVPQVGAVRARNFASRTLTVTNSPWLTDSQFEHIAAVLAEAAGPACSIS